LQGSTIGSDDGQRFRSVEGWLLQAFPRRTKNLIVQVVQATPDRKSWRAMAEFHIRNPLFGSYSTWIPEPLPAAKTNGDLSVTLTRLQTGLSLEEPPRPAQTNESAGTRALLQILQTGRPSPCWRPKMVEISDATGNRWAPFIPLESLNQSGNPF